MTGREHVDAGASAGADVEVDVLVVGAGRGGAGRSRDGHWLARRTSLSFLIVDGAQRLRESWRQR